MGPLDLTHHDTESAEANQYALDSMASNQDPTKTPEPQLAEKDDQAEDLEEDVPLRLFITSKFKSITEMLCLKHHHCQTSKCSVQRRVSISRLSIQSDSLSLESLPKRRRFGHWKKRLEIRGSRH